MKNLNYVVEVIQDGENRLFVIRDVQGRVIKVCSNSGELATFFDDVKFEG